MRLLQMRLHAPLAMTVLVAALQCGCGLGEYESLMASAQARARRFDEENRLLGDPVKWPETKEGEKDYVDVFFRLPRGMNSTPNPNKHGVVYVFSPSEKSGSISEIWVGASSQLDLYKELKPLCPTTVETATLTHVSVKPADRSDTLNYELRIFDDAASTYTYVLAICKKETGAQVAIRFHLEKTKGVVLFASDNAKPSDLIAKLQLSLESLAVDSEAVKLRRAFASRPQKSRAK